MDFRRTYIKKSRLLGAICTFFSFASFLMAMLFSQIAAAALVIDIQTGAAETGAPLQSLVEILLKLI